MDNDNKIKETKPQNIHNEVLLFLGDELDRIHHESTVKSYDLEGEYEKTKKHKTFFTLITLSCTFICVIGIAWGISTIISKHNEEVTVSLSDFDDLNLKNLLDTVSKAQTQYDNALKNKMNLENDMDTAIRNADNKLEDDLFTIESMKIRSKKEHDTKVEAANEEHRKTIAAIHEEYDSQIALAEKQVAEYKAQVDEYNTSKIESAKEQERLLDSERQLRALQQKELTDKYEKRIADLEVGMNALRKSNTEAMRKSVSEVADKYQAEIDLLDPVLKNDVADVIIASAKEKGVADYSSNQVITDNSISYPAVSNQLNRYQNLYDNYKVLDNVVAGIPQKNSIPSYVAASHEIVNEMGQVFVDAAMEMVELNKTIDKMQDDLEAERQNTKAQKEAYEASYDSLLTLAKANALVVSVNSNGEIQIFISPKARYLVDDAGAEVEIKAAKSIKGTVVKKDDGYIFVPAVDKDGKEIPFDISSVTPGTLVKIIGK